MNCPIARGSLPWSLRSAPNWRHLRSREVASPTTRCAQKPMSSRAPRPASRPWPNILKSRDAQARRPHSGCACHGASRKKTAYIALGSNLGDRVAEIEKACNEMDRRGIRVKRTSSLWETEPIADGLLQVETELEPLALLDQLQAIERDMGRRKLVDKGPRNIDLDILLYGDEKVHHGRLTIPHVGVPEREFVLRPLAELIPSKPLDPSKPWKLVQDYLNELPSGEPLSSVTPLAHSSPALTPLVHDRKTHVMAILNVTPDSFSDGGRHMLKNLSGAIVDLVRSGATIIDVGGQSTAPGRPEVTAEEEEARVIPAVELIRSMPEARDVAISVDTYRASVAERAVASGADIINDVSAGTLDAHMLSTVARLGKTICLMHMRGTPRTMMDLASYPDGLVPTVASELLARVAAAERAGIRRWRVILDPGIGFAKTGAQNLELLRTLDELRRWPGLEGLPWLVGASRKGFVGKATGAEQPSERIWGTAATVAAAVQGGADVVRVHDAREMAMVAAMSDAIWRSGRDSC
ncbi:Folic acid synthesis protein fol1 [Tolypocladium paradoxum]|uniref:Folic acid synthesis protein FOL1 n=1 Tax=Tolypocladium paradoxum TaxID=94208 RepID=A0A2S4KZJ5_9HYPO|nr:Folic acid synthesis protein fol1 [Tolypocladium paradoxum]